MFDADILDVGKTDDNKYKFFGDKTFKEWKKENRDSLTIEGIESLHYDYPEESYEKIAKRLSLLGRDATLLRKGVKEEFGVDHPDVAKLYSTYNTFCSVYAMNHTVKASDDRGHSDRISFRLGGEVISVKIESRLLGHIRYMIEHGMVQHRLLSDFARHAIMSYTLMHPAVAGITDPEHLKFVSFIESEVIAKLKTDLKEHFDILRTWSKLELETLMDITSSNIDREERFSEFTEKITHFIGRSIMSPMSSIEKGLMKDFMSSDFSIRQILSILVREGYIEQDYVDLLTTRGDISESAKNQIKQDVHIEHVLKVGESSEDLNSPKRVCCICGNDKTYTYNDSPKWYKHYDGSTGTWDKKSYKCRKCYTSRYL